MKIVVAEKIAPAAIALLREQEGWTVATPEKDFLAGELPAADALLVRSAVFVDAATMDKAPRLRVIGRAGVGVDNIDLDAATKRGIAVMNTPGGNAIAVAEHTLALMLALARHLTRADTTTHAGKWEKKSLQGTELRAKTLGIVGLGRVGIEVAKRALAFGMKVIAHDPYVAASLAQQLQITLASLDEVFAQSDYLTLHVGLTPQTQCVVNTQRLAQMKKGARLINCARGELLDDKAVVAALEAGQLGGAALDVFASEPLKESPYHSAPNVILTPHIAGSTNEAQDAVGIQIAQQVREYLLKGVIQNAVNAPSVNDEEYQQMLPYIGLAERLGSFLAQSSESSVEEIVVGYSGDIGEWKTELIRNAAVAGVLNQMAHERANIVNAASIAEERGIRHSQRKKERGSGGGAVNVITLTLKTAHGERTANGAILHGNWPRILSVDHIDIEAPLEGNLIYLRNRDVPGVVGCVGTALARHDINIARFSLGRSDRPMSPGGAIAIVQVDNEITEAVLHDLRQIEALETIKVIRFNGVHAKGSGAGV
jgi:D-3-phosphoglycerate dehydrogenase